MTRAGVHVGSQEVVALHVRITCKAMAGMVKYIMYHRVALINVKATQVDRKIIRTSLCRPAGVQKYRDMLHNTGPSDILWE